VLGPGHPAAAAPADVSVTAGPPGTRIEVSVAGTALLLEPVVLDVTGRAPTDRIDLTAPADSSVATLAGEAGTSGPVEAHLMTDDLTVDDLLRDEVTVPRPAPSPDAPPTPADHAGPPPARRQRPSRPGATAPRPVASRHSASSRPSSVLGGLPTQGQSSSAMRRQLAVAPSSPSTA
jgi:hypothetical protein